MTSEGSQWQLKEVIGSASRGAWQEVSIQHARTHTPHFLSPFGRGAPPALPPREHANQSIIQHRLSALLPAHLVCKVCEPLSNQQLRVMAFPTLVTEFNQELMAAQLSPNACWGQEIFERKCLVDMLTYMQSSSELFLGVKKSSKHLIGLHYCYPLSNPLLNKNVLLLHPLFREFTLETPA